MMKRKVCDQINWPLNSVLKEKIEDDFQLFIGLFCMKHMQDSAPLQSLLAELVIKVCDF